jgi:predicted DNA-binding transcriptional regulator YafY
MPSFADAIRKDLESVGLIDNFIAEQERKAPKRKPKRVGRKPRYGTLFALRNKRTTIAEAALRRVQVVITYRKTTTNETKKYVVAPYSYRYRRLKIGTRKMLMAYDMKDKHIKGFAVRNVRKVALTDRKFKPKWPVEIG